MLSLSKPNIYAAGEHGTALHQAIQSGNQARIDTLLSAYEADFDKVRRYLLKHYDWKDEDKIWLKKHILVAVNEAQCLMAKQHESRQLSSEQVWDSLIVLLQVPIDDEEVAVIFPHVTDKLTILNLVTQLIPNGFLSWNCFGVHWHYSSLIEAAVECGNTDLIERLYELGAEIVVPNHNAFLSACNGTKPGTIRWLLTKYNNLMWEHPESSRALYILSRKKDAETFEFVLDKMIAFRQEKYAESVREAFTTIFVCHFAFGSTVSILKHLRHGPMRDSVEKCIAKYKPDLFGQCNRSEYCKSIPIISHLMGRRLALSYICDEIRNNVAVLGMKMSDNTTLLHWVISWGCIEFLEELYTSAPDVKKHFETDNGFIELQSAICDAYLETIRFILKYHGQFLKSDAKKFEKDIILHRYEIYPQFPKHFDAICDLIPELRERFLNLPSIEKLSISSHSACSDVDAFLLHKAVMASNCKLVGELLDNGWNVDSEDKEGNFPIHLVRDVDILELLLKRHTDGVALLNRTNREGNTALINVCRSKLESVKLQLLEKMLACGADVNHLTKLGESVVFMADSCEILDLFLKHNANLEIVNNKGETALLRHLQNRNANVATALLLLTHKYPSFKEHAHKYLAPMIIINEQNTFNIGYKPFLTKYPEIFKALLDAVYQHSREEASQLFATACFRSLNFIVEKILDLDYDLDFNCKGIYGRVPLIGLFIFTCERNDHIVQRLLQKGANVELCDGLERNALLTIAADFGSLKRFGHGLKVVQMLLDHGANVDAKDKDGNTALHHAFAGNEIELVELLVRNRANLRIENADGQIPRMRGSPEIQQILSFIS